MNRGLRLVAWFLPVFAAAAMAYFIGHNNNFVALLMALAMSIAIWMARKKSN